MAAESAPQLSVATLWVVQLLRFYVLLLGSVAAFYVAQPPLQLVCGWLRSRWRPAFTGLALAASCGFFAVFIVTFGRQQFGGYDHSILVDIGWREFLGQHAYTTFPSTTPPAFNLGLKFAYELFGPTWNANLYATALLSCITFLWIYALLVRLPMGRIAAFGAAFAVECAAVLTLSFWWYNSITLVMAAVFYAVCLLLLQRPESRAAQVSFPLAFALTALTKPNIAGATLAICVVILLIFTPRRGRLLLLTLGGVAFAVGMLMLSHVSIPALISAYRGASRERGLFSDFGFQQLNVLDRYAVPIWLLVLSFPVMAIIPRFRSEVRAGRLGLVLLLFLTPLVAFYGVCTNGEFRDVEATLLIIAGVVVAFKLAVLGSNARRLYFAVLIALIATDIYAGAERMRVFTIGPGKFFQWGGTNNVIRSGYFSDMRVGDIFMADAAQTRAILAANPGPVFFGTRLEFNYAVFGLTPPADQPSWWEPGTAFDRADQDHLIDLWEAHRFATLIFLHDDHIYYSQSFLDRIGREYTVDSQYAGFDVYHRKSVIAAPLAGSEVTKRP